MQEATRLPSNGDAAPLRVVIADDNADLSVALGHVIDAEPDMHCVACVESATHVVEVTRTAAADVLLLDLRLRDGTGMDVIEELRSELPRLRVLVFSGMQSSELADEARRRGADAFVVKSGDLDDLLAEIRGAVAGPVRGVGAGSR